MEIGGVSPLRFVYNAHKSSSTRASPAAAPPMPNPPQIQVMHSLPHHESYPVNNNTHNNDGVGVGVGVGIGGGGDSDGDGGGGGVGELAAAVNTIESTPNDDNTMPKVLETPAVKSRHVDPNSSPAHRLQQSHHQRSPSAGRVIQLSKSGIMIGGTPENIDDFTDDDESGNEGAEANLVPTAPMNKNPGRKMESVDTVASPPPSTTPPPGPIESPILECVSPKAVVGDVENLDLPRAKHVDMNELPDSLPEVFNYVERKSKNRETKYSRKKERRSMALDAENRLAKGPDEPEGRPEGSAPVTAPQKKRAGRKRKAAEETPAASTKKRRGMEEGSDGDGDQEPPQPPKPTSKGKRSVPGASTETGDTSARKGRRKTAAKSTPPPPGDRSTQRRRKESSQFNTQYTLPDGSDADSESERGAHAPKPPPTKARGKTTSSKKAPATTAKKAPAARKSVTARPDGTPEPTSETKRLRTQGVYEGTPPRICFTGSALAENKSVKGFIRSHNSKTVSSPADPSCNYLVHGPGELKRTSKLIIAVARGIRIVEEQWLLDSQSAGYWVDPEPYVPCPPKEWDIDLSEAIERGRQGQTNVLKGKTVFLTPSLLAHLKQLQSEGPMMEMLKAAGAEMVYKKGPRGDVVDDSLVLGKDEGDGDLGILEASGWKVYGMTLIGLSVLRGKLLQGDELLAKPGEKEPEAKRRAGRKSSA